MKHWDIVTFIHRLCYGSHREITSGTLELKGNMQMGILVVFNICQKGKTTSSPNVPMVLDSISQVGI